jgi:hypothetical protein
MIVPLRCWKWSWWWVSTHKFSNTSSTCNTQTRATQRGSQVGMSMGTDTQLTVYPEDGDEPHLPYFRHDLISLQCSFPMYVRSIRLLPRVDIFVNLTFASSSPILTSSRAGLRTRWPLYWCPAAHTSQGRIIRRSALYRNTGISTYPCDARFLRQ